MNTDMHASIEELLEIKDGEHNAASQHVAACDHCQRELATLHALNQQLFAVADQSPRAELWQRIQETAGQHATTAPAAAVPMELLAGQYQNQRQQRSLSNAIYTLAASVLMTGFIGLYMFSQNGNLQTNDQLMQANIQQLMINSRGMEQALNKVALQSELLTTSQRTEADRLYWQLAYLDQMIHESNTTSHTDPQRLEVLWNNRIQALRELNQLYYQRQQTLDDSEI